MSTVLSHHHPKVAEMRARMAHRLTLAPQAAPDMQRAVDLARSLRVSLGLQSVSLSDPWRLAESLGERLRVLPVPELDGLGYYLRTSGRAYVFIRATLTPDVFALVLAHELGHHLAERPTSRFGAYFTDAEYSAGSELVADAFALAFLGLEGA